MALRIYMHDDRRTRQLGHPGLLLPLAFMALIVVGTILLMLPGMTRPGKDLTFIDAVFTATSAACITGLVVQDTGSFFTPLGQTVIAMLIQVGGLGILIFGSLIALAVGARLSVRQSATLSEVMNDMPMARLGTMIKFIILITLTIELIAAVLIFFMLPAAAVTGGDGDGATLTFAQRAGHSLFHAISGFSNAGFTTLPDSLSHPTMRYSAITHLVMPALILLGGFGFPVLWNMGNVLRWRMRHVLARRRGMPSPIPASLAETRLNLHTKLVLSTTLILYLLALVLILAGQLVPLADADLKHTAIIDYPDAQMSGLKLLGAHLADASFMSITARSCGFNSVPMESLEPASVFTLMVMMYIGAAPGGTGGGVKAITIAVLLLAVVATMMKRDEAQAFGRSIAQPLIHRAATVAVCYTAVIAIAMLLLLFSEHHPFEKIAFEAISAGTTTGLSLGITSELTSFGKGVIIVAMFLGRVGPLTLLGMLVITRRRHAPYAYAHEPVLLG